MLFFNYGELSLKGIIGKLFYWIRFTLCAFPIGSLIICIVWTIRTGSKNWSTIVNNTILILCIITIILSLTSFIFILFATLSILRALEKIFTHLYFFITIATFIVSFVLLSFGDSSHEIDYLYKFDKACGETNDVPLAFPYPTIPPPTPTPYETPTASSTPSISPLVTPNLANVLFKYDRRIDKDNDDNMQNIYKLLEGTPVQTPIPTLTPLPTPEPTALPKNFSESDFCLSHWTSWSRKKFIRLRTSELKSAFSGIISPWVIFFFIEFILMLALDPPQFLSKFKKKTDDDNNGLLDENLLTDQQNTQTNENDNIQLRMDSIFRDEDASEDENAQAGSNV